MKGRGYLCAGYVSFPVEEAGHMLLCKHQSHPRSHEAVVYAMSRSTPELKKKICSKVYEQYETERYEVPVPTVLSPIYAFVRSICSIVFKPMKSFPGDYEEDVIGSVKDAAARTHEGMLLRNAGAGVEWMGLWLTESFSARQALRYMIRNTTLPQRTRAQAQLQLSQMHAYTRFTQINNRCIEGGKSRGVLSDFRMARV